MANRLILITLFLLSLVAASFVVGDRLRVESRNRAVDLVLDYEETQTLAAASEMEMGEVLSAFKKHGATAVAIREQTVADAIDDGALTPVGGSRYATSLPDAERMVRHLRRALPASSGAVSAALSEDSAYAWLVIDGVPRVYINQLPIGLPADAVQAVRDAGLEPVARLVNYYGARPQGIDTAIEELKQAGVKKIIFAADQVLGYSGSVEDTAESLQRHGLSFGRVEFARQKGELKLAEEAGGNVIVVHSINAGEMSELSPAGVAERFRKAVRERGVRLCYVRMYTSASSDVVGDNLRYFGGIARGVKSAGYVLSSSHPPGEVAAPVWIRAVAAVGVAVVLVGLVGAVVELGLTATLLLLAVFVVTCAGLVYAGEPGRKAVALLAAIAYPTLALLIAIKGAPASATATRRPAYRSAVRLVGSVALASAGGLAVVALLSSRNTLLRTDMFAGVKVAHLAPILLVGALLAGDIAWKRGPWQEQKRRLLASYSALLKDPVRIWQALLGAAVVAAVAVLVMRSGNEGVEVSGIELRVRSLLDRLLVVRPRTKEFLLGYPALYLGIVFAMRGRRRIAAPLALLGTIGLVSTVNTFCHLHTPLFISSLRVFNGAAIGLITGLLVYWIVRYLPGREK